MLYTISQKISRIQTVYFVTVIIVIAEEDMVTMEAVLYTI